MLTKFIKGKEKLFGFNTIGDKAISRKDRLDIVRGRYGDFHMWNDTTLMVRCWKGNKIEEVSFSDISEVDKVIKLIKPWGTSKRMYDEANLELK